MNKLTSAIALALLPMSVFAEGAAAEGAAPNAMMSQFLLLGGFILIFYFLMWRPQSKRAKAHRDLLASISKDDEVVTNGGLVGQVTKVTDNFLRIKLADGVEVHVQKQAITCSLPKGTLKSI